MKLTIIGSALAIALGTTVAHAAAPCCTGTECCQEKDDCCDDAANGGDETKGADTPAH